jgi:hypothetical protein
MAKATEVSFSKFKVLIGDGATPTEAFDAICALVSKGVQRAAQTTSNVRYDCDDEDAPGYEEKRVTSLSVTISGSGKVAMENRQTMLDWYYSATPRNVKIQNVDAPNGDTEYEEGPAVLTQYNEQGERNGKMNCDITIEFAEQPTLVEAA